MYSPENYRRVTEEFDKKRQRAISTAEEHKAQIHAISPEIANIDRALSKTGLKLFSISFSSDTDVNRKIEEYKQENLSLQQDRRETLRMLGYPEDYTDVKYECAKCSDTGFVGTKMCSCMKRRLAEEGFRSSGLYHLIGRQTFDNFDVSFYDGDNRVYMTKVKERLKNYANGFSLDSENLIFMGSTGLGKTHLAGAIAKIVIENGYDVLYESAPNIISEIEAKKFGRDTNANGEDRYCGCDLLIIDDLGTETDTRFSSTLVYNIINTRMNNGRPTIISTNLDMEDIQNRYDARIASRIIGRYTPYRFFGDDIRIRTMDGKI